jgi:hypothetical protein
MSLQDLINLDEAIAEAEGLVSAAQWYWMCESESAYWSYHFPLL